MFFRSRKKESPLPISSGATAEGARTQDLGLVHGSAVVGVNAWKETMSAVTDVFGGRNAGLEATVDKGIGLAVATMQKRARALGADAVRDVRVDLEQMGGRGGRGGHLIVIAVGTAVREEEEDTTPTEGSNDGTLRTPGLPPFQAGR
ncbi:MAG: hypothetical protein EA356_01350 [Geminicoccaceae bacterium]|nr:MAG: hypothetical protein EA356_01350 [Geminicoccaceae bacterium]